MNRGEQTTLAIALASTVFVIHTAIAAFAGDLTSSAQWRQILVTVLASAALLSHASKLIAAIIGGWTWLFKRIMGKHYIRGTWAGTIITAGNSKVVFVEHYDQTTMGLTIRGRSYRTTGTQYDARWSTLCSVLDPIDGRLDCLYKTHVVRNGAEDDVRFGTGRFTFSATESNGAANRLEGIAVDEYRDTHLKYETVERLSDKLLDFEEARQMALDRFGPPVSATPQPVAPATAAASDSQNEDQPDSKPT